MDPKETRRPQKEKEEPRKIADGNEGDLKIAESHRYIRTRRASCLQGITGDPLDSVPALAFRFIWYNDELCLLPPNRFSGDQSRNR